MLLLWGAGVRPGGRLSDADPRDLMPTLAWLAGLPLSRRLAGDPLFGAFEYELVARRPVTWVDEYPPRRRIEAAASPADAALLESLRALGYVE